ncbi:MAG: hypothetical protein JF586_10935 [Burkholderiales bacterium]|nr:hypothetical protein [Burkholderiales bacterium]
MRGRRLPAVTAVVTLLHAAFLLGLARHGSTAALARTNPAAVHWIALAAPRQDAGPAPAGAVAASPAGMAAHRLEPRSPAVAGGATAGAQAASPNQSTPPPDPTAAIGIYRAATMLDVPVRTRSAPDIAALAGLPWSGLPLRLRLFIDAQGTVVDARILQSAEADDVAERVRRMFLATGFTPGIEGGDPVPSYKDIELTIGTPS